MEETLIKVNKLIKFINSQATSNIKQIQEKCEEIQKLTNQLKGYKSYYILYLVEVYAVKIHKLDKAQKLCQILLNDFKGEIVIEGMLRQSYIHYLKNEYVEATSSYQKAYSKASNDKKLQPYISKFAQRFITSLKNDNIVNGIIKEMDKKYEEALRLYSDQLEKHTISHIQNKYFAAKAILQLKKVYPHSDIYQELSYYEFIIDEIISEKEERSDGEEDMRKVLHQEYMNRKLYINKFYLNYQQTLKSSDKKGNLYALKKQMAHKKIQKARYNINNQNPYSKAFQMLNQCQMNTNQDKHTQMLSLFVAKQIKVMERMSKICDHMQNYISGEKFKAYEKIKLQSQEKQKQKLLLKSKKIKFEEPIIQEKQVLINPLKGDFEGSIMEKINQNSDGHQKRYFYIKKDQIKKNNFKIYYTDKKKNISEGDDTYNLTSIKKLKEGKHSAAFERKQCNKFADNRCFSVVLDKRERSFYVQEQEDYEGWIGLIKWFLSYKNVPKMKNTQKNSEANTYKMIKSTKVLME